MLAADGAHAQVVVAATLQVGERCSRSCDHHGVPVLVVLKFVLHFPVCLGGIRQCPLHIRTDAVCYYAQSVDADTKSRHNGNVVDGSWILVTIGVVVGPCENNGRSAGILRFYYIVEFIPSVIALQSGQSDGNVLMY